MPDLASYPRPHLAVDLVALTLGPAGVGARTPELGLVVLRRSDSTAALPGRFVRERQTVKATVAELLDAKLGLRPRRRIELAMLDVYDAPDRDERAWAVSVAYSTGLREDEVARAIDSGAEVIGVHGAAERGRRVTRESLAYDHDQMVTTAVRRLRRRYERSPDPLGLLRAPYTLSQLRRAHEAVLDTPLRRDTFNRRMREFLEPATDSRGEDLYTSATVGRPAQLFVPVRRSRRDPEAGPFPLPREE
ncbi:NrtR DNA-binding winged helix domain-containing protein [Nocardioides sambongensis]|uniref:NrtR DNA-binding winged helix domain-containing protein n=1 Tax=Nocardioides sambongensis TaxID=2589074 RepID=UPI00112D1396|nr:NUDIX hydrolase [Nocardioides sambongensis]